MRVAARLAGLLVLAAGSRAGDFPASRCRGIVEEDDGTCMKVYTPGGCRTEQERCFFIGETAG